MAEVILSCDEANLVILGTEQVRCRLPNNQSGWITTEIPDLGTSIFVPLTYQEGFELAGGIIGLWALAWVAATLINVIRRTRYM